MKSSKPSFTLANAISGRYCHPEKGWINKTWKLTQEQKDEFVRIFGKGCTERRKHCLRAFIEGDLRQNKSHGIYDRVVFNCHVPCQYVAGQDYPSEIRIVRELVCGW